MVKEQCSRKSSHSQATSTFQSNIKEEIKSFHLRIKYWKMYIKKICFEDESQLDLEYFINHYLSREFLTKVTLRDGKNQSDVVLSNVI